MLWGSLLDVRREGNNDLYKLLYLLLEVSGYRTGAWHSSNQEVVDMGIRGEELLEQIG